MVVGCLLSAVQLSRWEEMLVRIAYDAVEGIDPAGTSGPNSSTVRAAG
jgi:hypothetical protein